MPSIKNNWVVNILIGALLVIGGLAVLSSLVFATAFSILLIGWMLVFAGIAQFIYAFFERRNRWSNALLGILYAIMGVLILSNPVMSLATLTLLLAALLMAGGISRVFAAGFGEIRGNIGLNMLS